MAIDDDKVAAHQKMGGSATDKRLKRELEKEAKESVDAAVEDKLNSVEFADTNVKPSKVLWVVVVILVMLYFKVGDAIVVMEKETAARVEFQKSMKIQSKAMFAEFKKDTLSMMLAEMDDGNDNVTAFINYAVQVGLKKAKNYKEWQKRHWKNSDWQIEDFNNERAKGR